MAPPMRDPAANAISGRIMESRTTGLRKRRRLPARAMQLIRGPKIRIQ